MIEIQYEPVALHVRLKGHAGAAVKGQDLICCAASTVTCILAANVRDMQRRNWLKQAKIRLAPGDAEILCTPRNAQKEVVQNRVDALCLGYALLAEEYPDFVRLEIKGGDQ